MAFKKVNSLESNKNHSDNDMIKNWFERNTGISTFFATVASFLALIVSIIVMIDSKNVSNQNLQLMREQLDIQKSQNNLVLRLEKPIPTVDSIYCLKKDGNWYIGLNISNKGRRPFKLAKGYFFVVNIKKDYLGGVLSQGDDIKYNSQGTGVMITRPVPDSIMSDLNTSFFMELRYTDIEMQTEDVMIENFLWKGHYYSTGNLLTETNHNQTIINSIKEYVKKKENDINFFN